MIRDQIVIGVYREDTRRKLSANSTLTLQKAMEALMIEEQVEKDASYFRATQSSRNAMVGINKQQHNQEFKVKRFKYQTKTTQASCYRCGKAHTDFRKSLRAITHVLKSLIVHDGSWNRQEILLVCILILAAFHCITRAFF